MASRARRDGDRLLAALVQLAIVVPALAVGWVRDDGRIAAVLYREPKLVAAGVLGWTFAAAFLWAWRRRLTAADLAAAIERPAMLALGAFLAYLAATGLWVRVPQNYFYELDQYLLLALLVVLLLAWTERDARLPGRVRAGLVASLAAVTAVGVLQILAPLPFLSPIDPEIGVAHPSLMGYKNPAALAVLGQLFLLAGWVAETRGNAGRGVSRRLGLGLLLAVELVYLVSLRSRTSYAALAAGSVFLVGLWLARRPPRRALLRGAAAAAAAVALVAAAVAIHAPARERARSALAYAASPRAYLESDRGVYLRNTLNMARHRPLGVGLGDWQTQYPVFRSVRRTADFMDPPPDVDVRRAHSDHVQLLGEAGWPGLVLWLGFLLLLAAAPIRGYLRDGRPGALFAAAQVVALAAAMASDYYLEMPYHKLQFFLVVYLALAAPPRRPNGRAPCAPTPTKAMPAAAVVLALVALLQLGYHVLLARKVALAAAVATSYRRGDDAAVLAAGRELAAVPGHTKTLFRDYLLVAHSARQAGADALAGAAARKSLELHPYHLNALRFMATVAADPETAAHWRRAYEHVRDEAVHGYEARYPPSDP